MYFIKKKGPKKWLVKGGERPYVVRKNGPGPNSWVCTCEAGQYRGDCKHVNMIRIEHNPRGWLPSSIPEPQRLGRQAFEPLWKMPRFVAEPFIQGPRVLVVFGRKPYFFDIAGNEQAWDRYIFDSCELAGTVVDAVVGDPFADGEPYMYVMDVVRWKGEDLRQRPLRERIKYVPKVVKVCGKPYLPMYWAYKRALKNCLAHHMDDKVIIKDMAAPYKRMRGWFTLRG